MHKSNLFYMMNGRQLLTKLPSSVNKSLIQQHHYLNGKLAIKAYYCFSYLQCITQFKPLLWDQFHEENLMYLFLHSCGYN